MSDEKDSSKTSVSLGQLLMSVVAAFFGVQNRKNFERDNAYIEKKGLKPYIIMGIILVVLFNITIFSIVKFVVP